MIQELLAAPWWLWFIFVLGGGITIVILWVVLKIFTTAFSVFRFKNENGNGNFLSGIVTTMSEMNQSLKAISSQLKIQTDVQVRSDKKLSKLSAVDKRTKLTHELLMKAEQRQRKTYPKLLKGR